MQEGIIWSKEMLVHLVIPSTTKYVFDFFGHTGNENSLCGFPITHYNEVHFSLVFVHGTDAAMLVMVLWRGYTGNENSLCGFPITGSIDILSLVHRPHGSYHTPPGVTPCWKPTRWISSPFTGFSHLVGDPFLPTQGGNKNIKMIPQSKFPLWALPTLGEHRNGKGHQNLLKMP